MSKAITMAMSLASIWGDKQTYQRKPVRYTVPFVLEITLQSGKRIAIEKNAVINMQASPGTRPREEVDVIKSIPAGITLDSMMNN